MRSLQISIEEAVRGTDYPNWNGYVKACFSAAWGDSAEEPVLRKKLRRKEMVEFFGKLPPTVVAIEACGGSHLHGHERDRIDDRRLLAAALLACRALDVGELEKLPPRVREASRLEDRPGLPVGHIELIVAAAESLTRP